MKMTNRHRFLPEALEAVWLPPSHVARNLPREFAGSRVGQNLWRWISSDLKEKKKRTYSLSHIVEISGDS